RHRRHGRRYGSRRRSRMPPQHRRAADAGGRRRARAPRRRGARRHDRSRAADRTAGRDALMVPTSHAFKENARRGLADPILQRALDNMRSGFPAKRLAAIKRLPEFEALREEARRIKDHTLQHLDLYLERYEAKVT